MGKTNKGQRTKGNTRPSSSVQSALLLDASGKSFGGFVGFDALEKDPVYVPVTGQPDDGGVDSDFRMVMRKMIKRDALTRLKAVQEFGDYCAQKDVDTVKSILPFWPRLFNKLALDCDRRIREVTHRTNGKLVGKVHRELAPYLRNILGVWLLGQCDPHAPSATAAQSAFAETFPQEKRSRALLFCKSEIFSYFKDNLCDASKFSNDVNVTSPEEAQAKQVFVLSSTLSALKLLFSETNPEDVASLREDFGKIVSEAKFWSYLKHKEAQIRCAWYSLMSSMCSLKVEVFLEVAEGRAASILVSCLAEKDHVAVTTAWEAALHILCHFGVPERKDFEHSVLPQLWSFLREGGRGNAGTLHPCLLPMLTKFPSDVVQSSSFQLKILDILLKSLFLEKVKKSRMECDAILQAFFECFTYFCFNLNSEWTVLLEKILLQQVLSLIDSSIYDEQYSHFVTSKLYSLLGVLLCKMAKVEEGPSREAFVCASSTFWTELYVIMTKFHSRKKTEAPSRQLVLLFRGIFDSSQEVVARERQRVHFEETASESDTSTKDASQILKVNVDSAPSPLVKTGSPSRDYLLKTLTFCYMKLCEDFDVHLLKILKELLILTLSKELFQEVLTLVKESEAAKYVERGMLKWWCEAGGNGDYIIDVAFLICQCVPEKDGSAILQGCAQKKDIVLLGKILERARICSEMEPFRTWLQAMEWMDVVLEVFKSTLSSLGNEESDSCHVEDIQNILDLCLSDTVLRKIITSEEKDKQLLHCIEVGIADVSEIVSPGRSEAVLSSVCQIVCSLLQNVEFGPDCHVMDDVVAQLFCMNLDLGSRPSGEAFKEMAWTILDVALTKTKGVVGANSLVLEIARKLHLRLLHSSGEYNLEFLPDVIHKLLNSLVTVSESNIDLMDRVLEAILLSANDWDVVREGLLMSILPYHVENVIFRPLAHEHNVVLERDKIEKMFTLSQISANVLARESKRYGEKELLLEHLSNLMWSLSFCMGNGFMSEDLLISNSSCLCSHCKQVLSDLDASLVETFLLILFDRASSLGSGWLTTLSVSLELFNELEFDVSRTVQKMLARARELDTEHGRTAVQIFLHNLPLETKLILLEETYFQFEKADDSTSEKRNLLGDLYCILHDSKVLNSNLGKKVVANTFVIVQLMDSKNNVPLFAFQSSSVLRCMVRQTSGLNEECWELLERIYTESLERVMSTQNLEVSDLLHMYRVACLGLVLFEYVRRFTEKSYALFPRDFKPRIESSFYEKFVLFFLHLSCEEVHHPPLFRPLHKIMCTLHEALKVIPGDQLFQWAVTKEPGVIERLVAAINSPSPHIQYGAHLLLMKFLPLFPMASVDESCEYEEGEGKFPAELSPLLECAIFNNEIITEVLSGFRIGDHCVFIPHTDSYRIAVGFLLVWLEIFQFLASSPAQLRSGLIESLTEKKLLPALFSNVFRLLPPHPNCCIEEEGGCLSSLFLNDCPEFGNGSSTQLHSIACLVFATALRKMPASVRTWFNNLDKQSADVVNEFTFKFLSGILIGEEMRPIRSDDTQFEGMVVRAKPSSREVVASYSIDDCNIDLCIRLPQNFPLAHLVAERRGSVAVAEQEWRAWMMQLTTVLNYQDGSILDGLRLWKRNLDKKFEGVEECMICYYILHNATLRLPKLSCKVCKKKFHSACLYKWFQTSNNSSCPLCRNEFNM